MSRGSLRSGGTITAPLAVTRKNPRPPGKPWMRAQIWAAWLRGRAENAEKNRNAVTLSKVGAQDIASLLDRTARVLAPAALVPSVPAPRVRLDVGDPAPTNKRYPHFSDAVPLEERRRTWITWLKGRRQGVKVGPEGVQDLLMLITGSGDRPVP